MIIRKEPGNSMETKHGTEAYTAIINEGIKPETYRAVIDFCNENDFSFDGFLTRALEVLDKRKAGRPPKYSEEILEEVRKRRKAGQTVRKIAKEMKIPISTIGKMVLPDKEKDY